MSLTTKMFIMLFAVNLVLFLVDLSEGRSGGASPLLNALSGIFGGGKIDVGQILGWGQYTTGWDFGRFLSLGLVGAGAALAVYFNPSLVPMALGLGIFTFLALIPTLGIYGFPYPIDFILNTLFGLMGFLLIFGIIRSE